MPKCLPALLILASAIAGSSDRSSRAQDWPMWRYDSGRTAASPHDLPDRLVLQWARQYAPRVQVWDDPLNNDLMQYDKVFEPIVMSGRVFVGFNDSDKVAAWDLETGEELWTYYTDGPVRFPAVGWNGRVFFTSDDGQLYCVSAEDGSLLWKFRGGPSDRKVLGNKRVISMWPARGGPVVRDGCVYFAASIWPMMGTFIYALDAETGRVEWVNDGTSADYIQQPHSAPAFAGVAPQGALAATQDRLLVPGGRSVPAVFDRHTGELLYFHLNAGGKGTGGSLVAADDTDFYVHTRLRGVRRFDLETGTKTEVTVNEPVLDGRFTYTSTKGTVQAVDAQKNLLWELKVDGSGDLIKSGSCLYAAGKDAITAISLPRDAQSAQIAWTLPVEGEVLRLVAGDGKLLAVTQDGRISAFGSLASEAEPRRYANGRRNELGPQSQNVRATLREMDADQGYALCFGADEQFLDSLVASSDLQIVAVDHDAEKVQRLRIRYDAAGLYGTRITLHHGDPLSFRAPPYIANLVVVGQGLLSDGQTPGFLLAAYQSVRPHGGALWFPVAAAEQSDVASLVESSQLPKAKVHQSELGTLVIRQGPLEGAAPWTHLYGNIANTVMSHDQLVKPPLGVLWFGGNSNMDVLPRHTHGPSEQVIGGRLFIEGIGVLSARDVYTGRILWQREFEDLDIEGIYYDETYKNTPLNPAYNQVHIPGANARGTNFVATQDNVYLVIGHECHVLDASTGETTKIFALPESPSGESPGRWTYIGIYEDILLAGTQYADYGRYGLKYKTVPKRGEAWNPNWFGSLGLIAMDRFTGNVRWKAEARYSFLHNGIVAGGGRVYLLDRLPQSVETHLSRRGQPPPVDYRLLALDARTGQRVWDTERIIGTWLSYSEERDILLQAGAAAPDRSPEEAGQGMLARRGHDGSKLWEKLETAYAGPCILHHDLVITNSRSYTQSSGVFSLLDGSPVMIANPITGVEEPWRYARTYGCNTAVASEHLLTFRSGAAGFYDLNQQCGVGNLGGFRSGCSSNLIIADGVLNAPDYTRTCSCGYQNQTSLALIHMPDVETWYASQFEEGKQGQWIDRLGINLGAPGARRAPDNTMWLEFPSAASKRSAILLEGIEFAYFHRHSSAAGGSELPWVAASGVRNLTRLTVRVGPADVYATPNDVGEPTSQPASPRPRWFTVRLYFAEPDSILKGQRIFDVLLQGETVLEGFDVMAESGQRLKSIVREFKCEAVNGAIAIDFVAQTGKYGAVLSGVEYLAD